MKNRKLKGRKSTTGLSGDKKKMAAYIKSELKKALTEKRTQLKQKAMAAKEAIRTQRKNEAERIKNTLSSQIKSIRAQIKQLKENGSDTDANLSMLQGTIKAVRTDAVNARKKNSDTAKAGIAKLSATYKTDIAAAKASMEAEYETELDKLKSKK